MKLLLDHCVPRRFGRALIGHEVVTAVDMSWDRLRNGALLAAAGSAGFDALLTVDQNLRHQQNLGVLPLAVVVIVCVSNDIDVLLPLAPKVLDALVSLVPRRLIEVS